MKTIIIQASTPYPIYLGQQILTTSILEKTCLALNKRMVMITDSHLYDTLGQSLQKKLQDQGLMVELLSFPAGEHHKTRETKQQLEDELLSRQYGRDTCLLALGGGVVSDLVGFLAATYCRGVPVLYLPTTLLAMVDASMGGKTGVNTALGKNLIGSFSQPHAVIMDTQLLSTLPVNEWQNGMVEMIKHGMIADAGLFELLQTAAHDGLQQIPHHVLIEMIYQSCLIKKTIVEQDEHEKGLRHVLNFGHTIGHAIEILEDYALSHGQAVAIGMLVEAYLAVQMGYLPFTALKTLQTVLQAYGLPLKTKAFHDRQSFHQALRLDKKSVQSNPRFVVLDHIGACHHEGLQYSFPVDPMHLTQALDWASIHFSSE
ncbi:MAG: 3-dehydroquinate synthase [Legionella sp.]|nr:MAG: 3-dehydroquinate synthase [Legionella sp.]